MPTIEWSPSPNYGAGRGSKKVIAIVDHITGGDFPGCLEWLCNPAAKASAGYLVTRTGRIIQMVKDADRSYHAGIVNHPNWPLYDGTNPNNYTIGIEHEGFQGDLTEEQYQATLCLHKDLIVKFGIPIDTDHIIGHYRIDSVNRPYCPGPQFPWDKLFIDLKGGSNIMPKIAILKFSVEDDWSAKDIDAKLGGVATYVRQGLNKVIPAEVMSAEKLIVIGGGSTGHPNEVLLSGPTKYDTAAVVGKWLG